MLSARTPEHGAGGERREEGRYSMTAFTGSRFRWFAVLVTFLVATVAASAGNSAPAGTRASATTLVDGTTDSITNLDPAGAYDFGTYTLDANVFEHLLDFKNGPKLAPSLATKCVSVGNLATWRCTLRQG